MHSSNTSDQPLAPGLYLVATPIGNLEDITLRALRILRSADRIACEDTRQTAKLLNHFGISTPTVSFHLHNETGRAEELIDQLKTGARIALLSDAAGLSTERFPFHGFLPSKSGQRRSVLEQLRATLSVAKASDEPPTTHIL